MSNRKTKGILIVILFLSVTQIEAAWTAPFRITYNSGLSGDPRIVVDGSFIYLVWGDNTSGNYEIYFKKSLDGGTTWQPVKRLTYNSMTSRYPEIAVTGLNIFVVWRNQPPDKFGGDIYFRKSTDGGTTWLPAKRLTYNFYDANPAVAVSGSNIYVVFARFYDKKIFLKKSTDGGNTWQPLKTLFISDYQVSLGDPAVAVSGSNIYVVWPDMQLIEMNYLIYFIKSTDGGNTWQPFKRLTNNPRNCNFPDIAVSKSNIYVIWNEKSSEDDEIYFRTSSDGGNVWQTCKRLTYNSGDSIRPDINFIGSNIYVTWEDYSPGNAEIYIKKSFDNGANWQVPQRLTYNSGRSMSPQIGFNTTKIYVFWFDDNPGNCEIFQKNSPIF